MIDEVTAKYLFRLACLANNYRDPFLRQVEKQFGLTRPELTVLFCLANVNGINATDVAKVTLQPKNTLSRGVLLLVNKRLITKSDDPVDGRRSVLYITKKGNELYSKIVLLYEEAEHAMLTPLDGKDLSDLDRILTKMCDYIEELNEAS